MSQVIDLQTKITQKGRWRSVEVSTIQLRNPVARDLIGLDFTTDKLQMSMATLVSRISGLSVDTVLSIEVGDWMKIIDRVNVLISGKR